MSNATRIPITATSLCGDENGDGRLCSYVLRYLEAHGLGVGDTWVAYEYMEWIGKMHRAFREPRGIPEFRGYSPQEQREFDDWLIEQAHEAAQVGEGEK